MPRQMDADINPLQSKSPTARTHCVVAFCNRTRNLECEVVTVEDQRTFHPAQWICAKHWPRIATNLRQRHSKAKRAFKRNPSMETANEELAAWDDCVKAANEAAAGI